MFSRRELLQYGGAAIAIPAFASSGRGADYPSEPTAIEVQKALARKLAEDLGDMTTADKLALIQTDVGFTWSLPTLPVAQMNSIVAYSFGNRPNAASGNTSSSGAAQAALPDPGPLNELLADAVFAIYRLKTMPIYAQWEIARFLASKYGLSSPTVFSVEPIVNPDGSITYLSTQGVAAAIVARVGKASALGNVAVVGHRDHAKRCIETSILTGMSTSYAAAEVALPLVYDPLSGQPWTRNRSLYLVHDMYAQLALAAYLATAQAYPKG